MTWDVYDLTQSGNDTKRGHITAQGMSQAVDGAREHWPDVLALAIAPRGFCAPGTNGLIAESAALVMLVDGVIVVSRPTQED